MTEEIGASPAEVTMADVCIAYKQAFATPEGQIVLHDLLRAFGFTRKTTADFNSPERIFFNEGQRTVLAHMGRMIDADPSEFDEYNQSEMGQ